MSSKRDGVIWKAEPHTKAKIILLQSYLGKWFQILGRSRLQSLLYIDGFAGPGEYTNFETGSPVAAFNAAQRAIQSAGRNWAAFRIHLVFIEENPAAAKHLEKKFATLSDPNKRIKCYPFKKSFVEGLQEIQRSAPNYFSSNMPLFAFIDPFGATGVPFDCVRSILASECSEILLNFDADGVERIRAAGVDANADNLLTAIYGDDSWHRVQGQGDMQERCRQMTDLYKKRLRSIDGVKYIFAFEMRGKTDRINYYLIFATRHPLGLKK